MNNKFGSPFEDLISAPGIKKSDETQLTLPEIRKSIISANLIGRVSGSDNTFVPGPFFQRDSEGSLERLVQGLEWYFRKVRGANPARWEAGQEAKLCTNFGVQGRIRFLAEMIRFIEKRDGVDARELTIPQIEQHATILMTPILQFVNEADDETFSQRFKVPFGSGGAKEYANRIYQLVNSTVSEFCPPGFEAYVANTTIEQQKYADQKTRFVQDFVHRTVVTRLKVHYGPEFFDKAITNKEIKKSAFSKRIEDDSPEGPKAPEVYLDFIDLKKIVEQKENWPLFTDIFDIQLPTEKNGNAKYIKWFDEINRLRRISAHPFGKTYTQNDVDLLKFISDRLEECDSSSSQKTK